MSYTVKNASDVIEGETILSGKIGEIVRRRIIKLIRLPSTKVVAVQFDSGESDMLRYELQVSVVNE